MKKKKYCINWYKYWGFSVLNLVIQIAIGTFNIIKTESLTIYFAYVVMVLLGILLISTEVYYE